MTEHWEDFRLEYQGIKVFDTEDYNFGLRFLFFTAIGKIVSLIFFKLFHGDNKK